MECLSSLILYFASLPKNPSAPFLTTLALLIWQVNQMRPCSICSMIMYAILISIVIYEEMIHESTGSLFAAMRISPKDIELNLLLRIKYDPLLGLVWNEQNEAGVFSPTEGIGNLLRSFLRFLMEPTMGKIYRQ